MLAKEKAAGRQYRSRVERLRQRITDAPREVCVERARYLTQSMAANWHLHPLTRMSMALEHILDNISVVISDDELIVGCRTCKLKGAPLFPENKSRWIEGDLETFDAARAPERADHGGRTAGAQARHPSLLARQDGGGPAGRAAAPGCGRGHGQVHLHHGPGDHLRHRPLHHEPSQGAEAGLVGDHRRGRRTIQRADSRGAAGRQGPVLRGGRSAR